MRADANGLFISIVIAFVVAATVLALLLAGNAGRWMLDRPNRRSLHTTPTPRLGGFPVMAGIVAAWWWVGNTELAALWPALAALVAVSLYDDVRGAPVVLRFGVHLVAAGATAWWLLHEQFAWSLIVIAALAIAWVTNLYNFMDGADGLAGGMTLFGFSAYAVAAALAESPAFAACNAAIAAAAGGFLLYNFPPARVFLGDAGAIPLGFLAGALGVQGIARGIWPWWFALLAFAPFIVDASLTLLRRGLRRAPVWQAHREHYYQRLVRSGWTHRRVVLAEYALMAASGACAVIAVAAPAWRWPLLGVAVAGYTALLAGLERRLPRSAE